LHHIARVRRTQQFIGSKEQDSDVCGRYLAASNPKR
jgi:hypothetical protein